MENLDLPESYAALFAPFDFIEDRYLNDHEIALRILSAASAVSGFSVKEIVGVQRHRSLFHVRAFAMHLAYASTDLTLYAIGQIYKRDHTTVLNAIRRVDGILANNKRARNLYLQIRRAASATMESRHERHS